MVVWPNIARAFRKASRAVSFALPANFTHLTVNSWFFTAASDKSSPLTKPRYDVIIINSSLIVKLDRTFQLPSSNNRSLSLNYLTASALSSSRPSSSSRTCVGAPGSSVRGKQQVINLVFVSLIISRTVRWSNFERHDPKVEVFLKSTQATPCVKSLF